MTLSLNDAKDYLSHSAEFSDEAGAPTAPASRRQNLRVAAKQTGLALGVGRRRQRKQFEAASRKYNSRKEKAKRIGRQFGRDLRNSLAIGGATAALYTGLEKPLKAYIEKKGW